MIRCHSSEYRYQITADTFGYRCIFIISFSDVFIESIDIFNSALAIYLGRIAASIEIFLFAGVLSLGIALLTVSFQAIKAALADPVESLRYE